MTGSPLTPDAVAAWPAGMRSRMAAAAAGLRPLREPRAEPGCGVVLAAVRDGLPYLPQFLRHHRACGVRRFVFIDNGSVDGGPAFLLAQPDCDVYEHRGDYLDASASVVWRNLLLDQLPPVPWVLSIDVDECAVYPGWPARRLDDFAGQLRAAGHAVGNSIMLDMYGAGPVLATTPGPDGDLLAACPLFDGDGYTIDPPGDWRASGVPLLNIRGGPEMRAIRPRSGFGWLAKTALLLEPGLLYRNPHAVYPFELNFQHPRLALLHFRFWSQLRTRLATVPDRRATPGAVAAYASVAERLAAEPEFSLAYPGSVAFRHAGQLLARGLIAE